MKAVSVAAAAAVLGAAAAQKDTAWAVVTTPAAETKTTPQAASSTWSEWSTTSETPEAATTSTWSEWSTSSTPEAASTTSTWSEWSSETPAAKTTTTTSAEHTWGQWSTTSSTPEAASTTSKTWSEWSTTSSTPEAASTTSKAWSEWQTTSSSPAAASSTWSEWEADTTTVTSYTTQWDTVTVYNDQATATNTWSSWVSSSTPAAASSTGTWSSWVAPSADVNGCKLAVSVSYGQPVWQPTPTMGANSTSWSEWSSSTPAAASSTGTWSEWTSSTPVAASSTGTWSEWSSSTPVAASTSATWSEWQSSSTPVAASSATTWATWSSSAAASPTATPQGGNWGITTNGNKFGMAYSPYTANSQCKDQATITADVAKMASLGFTSVRVYSTDCKTLEYVGAACKQHNMKIILGVFISNTGISAAQPQVDDIVAWAQWDIVELIVVGNEAVFNNYCSASELASFIGQSKAAFNKAGYTGAVSTTDELGIWQSSGSAFCDVVDVVTANLYAFFNPNTAAADAGSFIQAQIQDLSKICPGKDVYVMESGWPSAGKCNGVACPSPENQATAIKSIQSAVGAKIIYFSFEDEQWKAPGQFGVEQHWGCANVFESSWGSY